MWIKDEGAGPRESAYCWGAGAGADWQDVMYEPRGDNLATLAFLWPAFAAASFSAMAGQAATQFAGLAVGPDEPATDEAKWQTQHSVALELETVRLRDFSVGMSGWPTLLCAPLASHSAAITDLAAGHSLVSALRGLGLERLFVTDWRSAGPEMRFLGIDNYLADLNVLVDTIGSPVDLVGLCQGGWMALIYAARFPAKVRKLVLAGAPVDIRAGSSTLTALAEISPLPLFHGLLRLGEGLVPGRKVMKFSGVQLVAADDIREVLQTGAPPGSTAFCELEATFRDWYARPLNLPARYFLDVVEKIYKGNQLAAGSFVALGRTIDLATVTTPMFLLAARDDELVAPGQLFAAAALVRTDPRDLRKETAPCRHVGLFMGRRTLEEEWPKVVRWLAETPVTRPGNIQTQAA